MTFQENHQPPLNGNDRKWMQYALSLADKAKQCNEVPVGAVIIQNDEILGEGFNQCITQHDPSAHAEMIALRNACAYKKNYRIPGTTLYVTLEPCLMCAGAMLHARIERLVYGAYDPKTGVIDTTIKVYDLHKWNHTIATTAGVLESKCGAVLSEFFKEKRK